MNLNLTQRAYSLRLAPAAADDTTWRARLWRTHCAVNHGAAAFGDWLLTLRGGLDHGLADSPVKRKSGECPPDDDTRRARRILLALSWLTVEVGYTGPHAVQAKQVVDTLGEILRKRRLPEEEINKWVHDCTESLNAGIKAGATWVNRSAAFDHLQERYGTALTREEAAEELANFLGKPNQYLARVNLEDDDELPEAGDEGGDENFASLARSWVSRYWGCGRKNDLGKVVDNLQKLANHASSFTGQTGRKFLERVIELLGGQAQPDATNKEMLATIRRLVGWATGRPSTGLLALKAAAGKADLSPEDVDELQRRLNAEIEKKTDKTDRNVPHWVPPVRDFIETCAGFPFRQERDHTGEFAVMLDHAARRVSALHTWIKRAEAVRRQFAADAAELDSLSAQHPEAVRWLDEYCAARTDASHAEDTYRIRPRAIEGWEAVVAEWQRLGASASAQQRIEAARALQGSKEIEKFGDIQLFEALAAEEARCVWESEAELLLRYAQATDAQHKMRAFKVPAYCHPDPLRHPVFCEFGNSRWKVDFAAHRARSGNNLNRARDRVTSSPGAVKTAEAHLRRLETSCALRLDLLDGDHPQRTELRWQSKRLTADLALRESGNPTATVSRADRHGRAAAGVRPDAPVQILGLFDEPHWNCRLEAPRAQLETLARYLDKHRLGPHEDSGWDQKARRLRDRIGWFVTFSARLRPQGPWLNYAQKHSELVRPITKNEKMVLAPPDKKSEWRGLAFPFEHLLLGATRKGRAMFALARLPGLRLLSADLGHRFGAACAVWETLSPEALHALCGQARPGPDALFHRITTPGPDGRPRTTLLRRIGPDTLPDGSPHPAPWARLERQFLIKLQGEEADARMAGPDELQFIQTLEARCGLAPDFRLSQRRPGAGEGRGPRPSHSVDDLMTHAVDTLRLALRRHTARARLARDFAATHRLEPGDRRSDQPMSPEPRAEHLTRALLVWYDLATSRRMPDLFARRLWKKQVAPHLAGRVLDPRPEDREAAPTRKARECRNAAALADFAAALTEDRRQAISHAWTAVWKKRDDVFRSLLARLRLWLRPRGLRSAAREQRIRSRHIGGLSLSRLDTLRRFHQVQKAFFTRLRPDGSHPTPSEAFGRRTLDALERLREQRVKQLASRIAAAALGLAPAAPSPAERHADEKQAVRLARQRLGKLAPRFTPCHAVVIENLSHYRPDQSRTRRENRQLMQWSRRRVRKFLAEACQLHGLHLREVSPAYTSLQDSRTGAPGCRCVEVPLTEFRRADGRWARAAERIRQKMEADRTEAERLLLETFEHWTRRTPPPHRTIRLLQDGGDLFVSADPDSPAARGLQADLNAAANIGLRALLDPDWPGAWWYVPCDRATHVPLPKEVQGCPLPPLDQPDIPLAPVPAETKAAGRRENRRKNLKAVNLWRDACAAPLTQGNWRQTPDYWADVQRRVARVLRHHNGLLPRATSPADVPTPPAGPAGDDVPL